MITAPGVVEITKLEDPTPHDGEVVVEVAAVGLCGTDLHLLAGEHGELPVVPGHEVTGTVVGLGTNVAGLHLGDRVAIDPNLPCRACRWCRRGRENLCPDLGALGVTTAGGAAELMTAPAASCVVLAEHVDLVAATLIEPLSCAVRGYDVLGSHLGASVLVYGAGTMGLMMLELAKRTGAVSVDVIDPNAERLAIATQLGCGSAGSADALDRPEGWDVVVDATGNAAAIQDGLGRVARGGTFLQFGVSSPQTRATFAPFDVYRREITITGSMAVLHSFERAADLFASGVLDPAVFITRQAPLEQYRDAIDAFAAGEGLKTQILPQELGSA
jgi:2-desacetyl-2-hydroxyethyl bacteriochlorophyllide A dehydrogenase